MLDRKVFFDHIRGSMFRGSLSQEQVIGIDAIISAFEKHSPDKDERKLAYVLATPMLETGERFNLGRENLNYTSAARIRAVWPSRFKNEGAARPYVRNPEGLAEKVYGNRDDLGNVQRGDGWTYRGAGWPQLTGRRNFRVAGKKVGVDLEADPELATKPDISGEALVAGMYEGWFTGRKLDDYITDARTDFERARQIINGMDRYKDVAAYAEGFLKAIRKAGSKKKMPSPGKPPKTPEKGVSNYVGAGIVVAAIVAVVLLIWFTN